LAGKIEEANANAPPVAIAPISGRPLCGKNGKWSSAYTSKEKLSLPSDLKNALMKNKTAWKNFKSFANSYQNIYIGWITNAKREETRKKRIKEVVRRSASNQKPGMM